jgi:hypothetical protein
MDGGFSLAPGWVLMLGGSSYAQPSFMLGGSFYA